MESVCECNELIDSFSGIRLEPFAVKLRIVGNDALYNPCCTLDDALCNLCSFFIYCSLRVTTHDDSCYYFRITHIPETTDGNKLYHEYSTLTYSHYTKLSALKASRDAGCPLCDLMWQWHDTLDDGSQIILCAYRAWRSPRQPPHFDFNFKTRGSISKRPGKTPHFEFLVAESREECLQMPFSDIWKLPLENPFDAKGIKQAKEWYLNCVQNHNICQRQALALPLRLIDVDSSGDDNSNRSKLVETRSLAAEGKVSYVALTYCWGDWDGLVTTNDNIQQMLEAIPEEDLPKTVQNAISFCRMFGLRYLWVDALCIRQGDKVEWGNEAANMGNIYGGCEFAISALSSSKASEGFSRNQFIQQTRLGEVYMDYGFDHTPTSLWIRGLPKPVQGEIRESPLSRRGWALQESLLSPALLHFGQDQIMWECDSAAVISETGERWWRAHRFSTRVVDPAILYNDSKYPTPIWDSIVQDFTARKLTYAKDRLAAIAGIAHRLRDEGIHVGRFICGLWESHLSTQLLWCKSQPATVNVYELNESVPTWSWARENMLVFFPMVVGASSALTQEPEFELRNIAPLPNHFMHSEDHCAVVLHGYMQEVGPTAISIDSEIQRGYHNVYHGLPGKGSQWFLDRDRMVKATYYCLRMRHHDGKSFFDKFVKDDINPNAQDKVDGSKICEHYSRIWYLLIRRAIESDKKGLRKRTYRDVEKDEDEEESVDENTWVRAGILILEGLPRHHFYDPYPDIQCNNGKPLLSNGKYMEIRLV